MTKRSKRMAKYLEEQLGWQVYDRTRACKKCHIDDYMETHKFCAFCGEELGEFSPKEDTLDEIEYAIQYALKENEKR